jgi:predicted transcriptional regulator
MDKADIKKGEEIVNRLAEKKTLQLFKVGCDEKNFEIIRELPMTAKDIEKKLDLSPMPTNRRIKELMEVGLVHREKRGKEIKKTEITDKFIEDITLIKEDVIKNMARLI